MTDFCMRLKQLICMIAVELELILMFSYKLNLSISEYNV